MKLLSEISCCRFRLLNNAEKVAISFGQSSETGTVVWRESRLSVVVQTSKRPARCLVSHFYANIIYVCLYIITWIHIFIFYYEKWEKTIKMSLLTTNYGSLLMLDNVWYKATWVPFRLSALSQSPLLTAFQPNNDLTVNSFLVSKVLQSVILQSMANLYNLLLLEIGRLELRDFLWKPL